MNEKIAAIHRIYKMLYEINEKFKICAFKNSTNDIFALEDCIIKEYKRVAGELYISGKRRKAIRMYFYITDLCKGRYGFTKEGKKQLDVAKDTLVKWASDFGTQRTKLGHRGLGRKLGFLK
jgi:hypothetical protein